MGLFLELISPAFNHTRSVPGSNLGVEIFGGFVLVLIEEADEM